MSDPPVQRTVALVRAATRAVHYVSVASLVGVLALIVLHILGRNLLGWPVPGAIELTELAMILLVYLALGYAQLSDSHITVDILYVRLSPRGKLVLDLLSKTLTALVGSVLAWRLLLHGLDLAARGRTSAVLDLPLRPFALVGAVGALLFAAAAIVTAIDNARRHGPQAPGSGREGGER